MESIKYLYYDISKSRVFIKTWLLNGKMHRTDGPAEIWYSETGEVIREAWYINGNNHRADGPAIICYEDSGVVTLEAWYVSGMEHRTDGPAKINYDESGRISREVWTLYGKPGRVDDDPSYIQYLYGDDGKAQIREYWAKRSSGRKKNIIEIVSECVWSRRLGLMKRDRKFVEWYYGPMGLGGRRDRQNLAEFATGL